MNLLDAFATKIISEAGALEIFLLTIISFETSLIVFLYKYLHAQIEDWQKIANKKGVELTNLTKYIIEILKD